MFKASDHGLNGYLDVMESVRYALTSLGHGAQISTNDIFRDRINVIFGIQLLLPQQVQMLPDDTIIYNLEQISNAPITSVKAGYHTAAGRFRIWDYSRNNCPVWPKLNPRCHAYYVPIGWAPTLERISPVAVEDIDVLFYGMPNATRMTIYGEICVTGAKAIFVCGLYGRERDDLIARSKLVLNLRGHPDNQNFEIVRVSYLLANAKAVVSDDLSKSELESDLHDAVVFTSQAKIAATCQELLADDAKRRARAERGRAIFRQ